jgi:hypothetical protein
MRLRTLLSLILAFLLMATSGFIGWRGYSSSHLTIKRLTEKEFALADGTATHEVRDFLDDPANRLLDEFSIRTRRGMLNLKDDHALGFDLAERLRANPTLAWISYSDAKTGHFVGVWRTSANDVVLNITSPGQGEPHEMVVATDGTMKPYARGHPSNYDPRDHPWFKNAMAATGTVWSAPYTFVDGDRGITASRACRPTDTSAPQGVFTVDFYLKDLRGLLDNVAAHLTDEHGVIQGLSVILEPNGDLVCSSQHPDAATITARLGQWVRANPHFKNINGDTSSTLVELHTGKTLYLVAIVHLSAPSGLNCIVASMVPKGVFFNSINRAGVQIAIVGLTALGLAVLAGFFIAYRISEPLRILGNDLAKVGRRNPAAHRVLLRYRGLCHAQREGRAECSRAGTCRLFRDSLPPVAATFRNHRQIHRRRPARLLQCAAAG